MELGPGAVNPEDVDRIREIVYSDSPPGFFFFYYFIRDERLPFHCIDWICEIYTALKNDEDIAIESFRGSLKTTIVSTLFPLYQLALHADGEIMLVQDDVHQAEGNTAIMTDIIQTNPGFRVLFPHIVPDKSRRWGLQGWDIKDTRIPYGQYRRQRTKTTSLKGVSHKSSDVQGHHPRLMGLLDDVNTVRNSRYPREMKQVNDSIHQGIMPALDRTRINIHSFTPWRSGDIGDQMKRRPNVRHVFTPVYKMVNGEMTDEPVWPEMRGEKWIEREKANSLPHVWRQMYLLDLAGGEGDVLKQEYLHYITENEIPEDCSVVIAVDYASVEKDQALKGRDYFALAVLAIHPSGYLVLIDGARKHVNRVGAEDLFKNVCDTYYSKGRLMLSGIEQSPGSEDFANEMLRSCPWPVRKLSHGSRSKGDRYENQLAPIMHGRKLRILESSNEFITHFEEEYLNWDGLGTFHDDCLDAVYYATRLGKKFINWKDDDRLYSNAPAIHQDPSVNPLHRFARRRHAAA